MYIYIYTHTCSRRALERSEGRRASDGVHAVLASFSAGSRNRVDNSSRAYHPINDMTRISYGRVNLIRAPNKWHKRGIAPSALRLGAASLALPAPATRYGMVNLSPGIENLSYGTVNLIRPTNSKRSRQN